MLTMSASPHAAFPAIPAPFLALWSNAAGVYGEVMRANTQQLLFSSAAVIQEQMLRAFISASQSCADALAKNAMVVQRQSMERCADANGKGVGLMGHALTQVWMESMQPAK